MNDNEEGNGKGFSSIAKLLYYDKQSIGRDDKQQNKQPKAKVNAQETG